MAALAGKQKSEIREIVRKNLDHTGYLVRFTTHPEGENLVARVHVTDAETDETVTKFVFVGNPDNREIVFGVDAHPRGAFVRDFVTLLLQGADMLRYMAPDVTVKRD